MNKTEIVQAFHKACQNIVDNPDAPALNWAVNYAKSGLSMTNLEMIIRQVPYILGNMIHWRGPIAKETRELLKSIK